MSVIASWYDFVNGDEYKPYADFLEAAIKRFSRIRVREVLDIGCGTGGITSQMADKGFDMTGLDISPDMLSLAPQDKNILYICRDMCDFELYGSVQAAYSSYDCINYLLSTECVGMAFSNVATYLESGGLFIFDVNTAYRAENVYDGMSYCYERGDDMLVWRSAKKGSFVDFYLTAFTGKKGLYEREDEVLSQRIWSRRTLEKALRDNGFKLIGVFGGKGFEALCETDEKAYYIAERI